MKLYTLIFAEPCGFSELPNDCVYLTVNDNMFSKLLEKPKEYVSTHESTNKVFHNAYLFGNTYPLEDYEYLGEHANNCGSTGLIDYNLFEAGKFVDYNSNVPDEPQIFYNGYDYDSLIEARKQFPALVFYGDTLGGDVGAALYVHYRDNQIDSVIIDNQYFFDINGNVKMRHH